MMEDKFVICPFNKSHIINRLRIQYHLVRCKKNYPNCRKIICPYNATEYIDPNNYINHLRQCKQNWGLDVSEEFKRKQFEMIQHGDASVQSYFTPSHVEVTDEWDKQSAVSNTGCEDEITPDEEKVMRIKSDSSKAIKGAYKFMPQISHPIGRGKLSEVYREFLNNQFKPESNLHTSPFAPLSISSHYYGNDDDDDDDDDDDGIFDDADASDDENKMENTDVYYNDSFTSFGSKYYKPSLSRGRRKFVSIGRGVPVCRNGVSHNDEAVDTSYSSLDIILQKLVLNEMALKKEKNISKVSKSQENVKIPLLDEMQSNNENTDSCKKSDILVIEDSLVKPQKKHLSNSFSLSSEILLHNKKTDSSVLKSSKNKVNYLSEDLFECTSTGKEEDKHLESFQNTEKPIESPSKSFYSIGRGKLLKNFD